MKASMSPAFMAATSLNHAGNAQLERVAPKLLDDGGGHVLWPLGR